MSDLAERIARLSPEKRALLEQRLLEQRRSKGGAASDELAIRRRGAGEPTVLSFGQQRLWFLEQLEPDNPLYIVASARRITGALDTAALDRALDTIAQRHEVLRTRIVLADGEPRPVVDHDSRFELEQLDLSGLSPDERERELERLVGEASARRFDLAREHPWRGLLIRCGPDEHVLITAWHHVASDAWSAGIYARELSRLYAAFAAGDESPLPELPIQYADWAAWQRARLQGKLLDEQLAYWSQQLGGSPPALELPADYVRPAVQTYSGAEETLTVDAELTAALQQLARREGATLFMVLLAAWKTLLWRYSEQSDMLVGTPVAGRSAVETEGLIGLFLNTLVLRTELDGALSFRELLSRVRAVSLGAFAHAELPFERLVEHLRVERDRSRPPLFSVMFNLRNVKRPRMALGALDVQPLPAHSAIAEYDLTLNVDESDGGLLLQLEYNTDLWQQASAARMLRQLRTLLAAAAANPDAPIARLALADDAERQELVAASRGPAEPQTPRPILELWRARVAAQPYATAFFWNERPTSYAELERRANAAANQLRVAGVRPGAVVGVYGERSIDTVAAFLGVLKAGGVYLPLDPAHPAERLRTMVADSGAELVLWHGAQPAGEAIGAPVLALDATADAAQTDHIAAPDEPAYIVYTSGSTGVPKGVVIEHGAIWQRLNLMWSAYPFARGEVGSFKTAVGFADAIWEMLGPLLQGVPSVIVPDDVGRDPARLVELLARHGVTRIWLVPTLLRALLDNVPDLGARLPALRMWVTTGEPISTELYERFRAELPGAELHNLYDTSEALGVAWYAPRGAGRPPARVPIGRPLGASELWVLDSARQPAPIGVPGELYVSSPAMSRGYLNRPELTAERFVAHPWGEAGARLYRTGDRARRLHDGTVEYLGRLDRQVKLRGFRIEPGEVEAALERHAAVQRAVVDVQTTRDGEQRMVAYLVEREGVDDRALREHLRALLPAWMLPAAYVRLAALPLTSSGKLDRRALPEPSSVEQAPASAEAPHDPLELQLKLIWEALLERHPIGVHDDFWELGGHSLLAVRLMARIEERLGRALPLTALFQAPTIAGLAALLRRNWQPAWTSLTAMQPGGSRPPLFWVPPAGSTILSVMDLARHIGDEYPLYAFQPRGMQEGEVPDTQVEEMARHYVSELRQLQPEGPYLLGGKCMGGRVAYEMARQITAAGQHVALLVIHDTTPRGRPPSISMDHYRSRLAFWQARGDLAGAFVRKAQRVQTKLRRRISGTLGSAAERRVQRVRDAHDLASRGYDPRPYAGGRVTTLWSSEFYELRGSIGTAAWSEMALSGFQSIVVPGDHHGLMLEPLVAGFAAQLRELIDAALQG